MATHAGAAGLHFQRWRQTRSYRAAMRLVLFALVLTNLPLSVRLGVNWAAPVVFAQDSIAPSPEASSPTPRFLFGPEDFVRKKEKPQPIIRTFSVAAPTGPATLCLVNGGWRRRYLRRYQCRSHPQQGQGTATQGF